MTIHLDRISPQKIAPSIYFVLLLMLVLFILTACTAPIPKRKIKHDTTRLLDENLMQGWTAIEKAPPVVGEFDVIYFDESNGRPPGTAGCSHIEDRNNLFIICPKQNAKPQKMKLLPVRAQQPI